MELLVVGAGEMGRWFAHNSGADAVAYADREASVAREAAAEADFDGARTVSLDTDERFDVVCVAVPMLSTPGVVAEHAPKATGAVVDVSGEMRDSVAALREHAPALERASFHPLFSAANAPGNVPVVVDRGGPLVDRIRESLSEAGNRVFETTVEEHDRAMETVQTKTHAAVLAYALSAEAVDERFHTSISEPLFELVGDVTGNSPSVYAEIQERFDGAADVADVARELAEADPETFERLYESAGELTDR